MRQKALSIIILFAALAGCNFPAQAPGKTPTPPPNATAEASPTPRPRATPIGQEPAAGICGSFEGELVTISINPDTPDPRCTVVRPDQTLKVINRRGEPIVVTIGNFQARLEAGGEAVLATPFGDYLAVGVHRLEVSPCCGAELWLKPGTP